jgi:DNA replication protein DnaC
VHEQRVQALSDLVLSGQHRLISVTGPPGAGKTRLATDVGRLLAERQSVRMDYVSLEGCARASDLEEVVESLPEQSRRAPEEVPEPYQKPRLLVLDNLEHLLPIDAEVGRFLEKDPGLSVIVVSRVATQIPGEREISLPPS